MDSCSGCGESTVDISHQCDVCGRRNHPFCGVTVGEGFAGIVRCDDCVPPPSEATFESPQIATDRSRRPVSREFTPAKKKARLSSAFAKVATLGTFDEVIESEPSVPVGVQEVEVEKETKVLDDWDKYRQSVRSKKRAPQVVSTIEERVKVVERLQLLEAMGEKNKLSRVVFEFLGIFTGRYQANLGKARNSWRKKDKLLNDGLSAVNVQLHAWAWTQARAMGDVAVQGNAG